MLSDREEQELGLIEQGLRDDSRLAASFEDRPRRPLHRRPGVVRTAIAVGLLLLVAGLMLAAAGLALQGLLLTSVSYVWWHWKVKPAHGNRLRPNGRNARVRGGSRPLSSSGSGSRPRDVRSGVVTHQG